MYSLRNNVGRSNNKIIPVFGLKLQKRAPKLQAEVDYAWNPADFGLESR